MTDVQGLIRQLKDPKQSSAAFKTLYEMSPTIVEPLLAALNDPDVAIRMQVATVLGNSGDPRAVDALMKAAQDSEARVRQSAMAALGKFEGNTRIADFLRDLARRPGNDTERVSAVFALGRAAGKQAAAELWLEFLNDPSPQVVGNAASQLATLKLAAAVEPLIATLNRIGEKDLAFMSVMMALGDLGDGRAFDVIASYLKSADPHKRVCAADALGRLGDERGIQALEPLLNDKTVAGKEDRGGPVYTVGDTVRSALDKLRKKDSVAAEATQSKPRWKFW